MNAMTERAMFGAGQGVVAAQVWVVVVAKPGQERRAKQQLEQQAEAFGEGFQVYLPMKLAMRKKDLVAGPFFPRYLFARVDLRLASWKRIWSTLGVHGLLGSSLERPYGVADWVIERIQAQEEDGFIKMGLAAEAARVPFSKGEGVRLEGMTLECVFEEMVDEKRCVILHSLFGRDSRTTVDIAKLRSTGGR